MRDDGRHVLFICEGSAERAILENLIEAGIVNIPPQRIVEDPENGTLYTTKRKASDITESFLNLDYGGNPLRIIRIIDSKNEKFTLPRGYESRATVETLLTRPEIEILAILRENAYTQWKKSGQSPSTFCKTVLNMPKIKQYNFIKRYWSDIEQLRQAIYKYQHNHKFESGERCLADLL